MGKYFGTDGIRGQFNKELTIDISLNIAIAAGIVFKERNKDVRVCIARDPRSSSKAIENALVAGFTASGVDVELLGVTTTPVVSYVILKDKFDVGVMISASHNPYYDNGIKFFGPDGKKLNDELEGLIEEKLDSNLELNTEFELGNIVVNKNSVEEYLEYLKSLSVDLTGLKICLDMANGSASDIADKLFVSLGADVECIGNVPNGKNINDNVGSTHPQKLCELVKNTKSDFGLAFDGDGDRVMLIDSDGKVLDGDYMIYLIANYLEKNDKLKDNNVVSTVMSNIGFKKALKNKGYNYQETAVGDRYVMQKMTELDASLGGEQSGHIILSEYLPTGDGILSGLLLANIIKQDTDVLIRLLEEVKKYPQLLVNIKVTDKNIVLNDKEIQDVIKQQDEKLGDNGRILVRASGTENLIRVMSEAQTNEECEKIIEPIIQKIKKYSII